MTEPSPTTQEFLANIADIRLQAAGRDRMLLRTGAVLMPLGILVGLVALLLSHGTDNPLDQRDAIVIAIIGATVSIVGVGVFVRYSISEFLRFWMARLLLSKSPGA